MGFLIQLVLMLCCLTASKAFPKENRATLPNLPADEQINKGFLDPDFPSLIRSKPDAIDIPGAARQQMPQALRRDKMTLSELYSFAEELEDSDLKAFLTAFGPGKIKIK